MEIKITQPTEVELKSLGVAKWPIWEKEEGGFDWYYDEKETCYFLEGEVEITLPGEKKVRATKGDLVVFPQGLSCWWNITKKVKKHYRFG